MTPRFRMVAGPNGSGKTTLARRLAKDYAVNFYDTLNADDIFAEVSTTGAYAPKIPVDGEALAAFAAASAYDGRVKGAFASGAVSVERDHVRFAPSAVNSYTVALLANFLQSAFLAARHSFSHETVFSHPSKLDALEKAKKAGYKTYLYFVATDSAEVNAARVANRAKLGGHSVPPDKIAGRYARSMENAAKAFPFLSRAYFFDNGGLVMRYLGEWNAEDGFKANPADATMPRPRWLAGILGANASGRGVSGNMAFPASAAAASREAVEEALSSGLAVTVLREGKVVRIPAKEAENV